MFTRVQPAAPDPILGLTEAYLADPNPDKINLAVGVFKDAAGKTPVLDSVKAAERRLVETQSTKSYLPIDGPPAYAAAVQRLMFGDDHPDVAGRLGRTSATPGGTGALRVAGDYLKHNHPDATVWVSDPTWANHHGIFAAAGLPVEKYAYLDAETNRLDLIGMLDAVRRMRPGDVVVLHGCCHNPTGVDPSPEQWRTLAAAVADRGLMPLMDFAYQGFGDGLFEDAGGLHALADACDNFLVCSSFSKNFGLYRDRCGALTVVAATPEVADAVQSQVKAVVRRNYSNPPAHGPEVVTTVLDDPELQAQWEAELAAMRDRIHAMRHAFAAGLDERGVNLSAAGNDFVVHQRGMFTMSGLTTKQVATLRQTHSIYVVGSGRINVAGMTEDNLPRLCDAIAEVTGLVGADYQI